MPLQINDNIQSNSPKPLNNKEGKFSSGAWRPYNDIAEAQTTVVLGARYKGLTQLILKDGIATEYWYRDGTSNEQLILKTPENKSITVWSDEVLYGLNDYVTFKVGLKEYLFRSNADANNEEPTLVDNIDWQLVGAADNATIDDSVISPTKVWSSSKTDQQKQDRPILTSADLSTAQVSGNFIYGLIDQFTGEYVNLIKIAAIPAGLTVDNIIIFSRVVGGVTTYYQRVTEILTFEMFGATGDGSTDDNLALQACINAAQSLSSPIHINRPKSEYRSSLGLIISKSITITGKDTNETANLTTRIKFDQNTEQYGINITTASASAGTILEGFTILESVAPQGGCLFEYSPLSGNILYQKGQSTDFVIGNTYQVRSAISKMNAVVNGEFVANGIPVLCQRFINIYNVTGSFQVGQVLTGATSGAKITILYIGAIHNALCGNTLTGTFVSGEILTTETGTAQFHTTVVNTGVRVIDVTSVTGNLNKFDENERLNSIINRKGYWRQGVLMQRRSELHNLKIQSFSGNGVTLPGDISNINCFKLYNVGCIANGGNGFNFEGTDANAGLTSGCTSVNNNGVAINDFSFLGNYHEMNHSAGNSCGAYFASSYDGRNSVFIDCYSEGSPSRTPFLNIESIIAGGSCSINGVDAAPVVSSLNPADRGQRLSNNVLANKRIDTYTGDRGTKLIATGFGLASSPLAVSGGGNKGDNRGVGFDFLGQWASNVSYEYASIFANYAVSNHYLQFKVRNTASPLTGTVRNADGSATSGTGAMLLATSTAGVITGIEIVLEGSGYDVNSIITVSGSTGTPAVIYPLVRAGKIKGIKIVDGGTGYTDSFLQAVVEVGPTVFRPITDIAVSLGETAKRYLNIYGQNIRTGAGTHRITSGTGSPEGVVTASPGSMYFQTDGSADQVIWTKRTGTTTTGWGLLSLGPKLGTLTVNGTGQTAINIPHGLGSVPTFTNVNPKSVAARNAGILNWTEDATNIIITLAVPADTGTNNLTYIWEAKL